MTRSRILVAVLALALVVSACGGGGAGPQAGGPSHPPAVDENDINPVPRDQVADGGTLRWPIDVIPPNYNYNQLDGPNQPNYDIMFALLPQAFRSDARGVISINHDLLQSAEITATQPQQIITYRINPKATWSDGKPITWVDFEAQWKALNGTDPAFNIAASNGYDQIERVARGKDDREAVVTFRRSFGDWRGLFSPLYPASMNSDPAVFNTGWIEKPLVTAGPFTFDRIDRTAETVTLVRDERWWGAPAKLDRIIFRVLEDDARADALANGEVDFIEIAVDVNKLQRAQATAGVEIRRAAGPNFNHITFNGTSEVLRDLRVRRAIAMGIDRRTITEALLRPLGLPAVTLGNHIFMVNQLGYQDNSGELGTYDPQKAAALLDEAGWRQEGGVRKRDGKELTLRMIIPAQVAVSQQIGELVQGMLGQIGVKVSIDVVPSADQFKNYITPGNYDLAPFAWGGTPYPISSSQSIYQNPTPRPDGQLDVRQNFARVGSAEIDQMFVTAITELDVAKATALANQIDVLIWQEVHSLPLYQRPDIFAVKSTLANFGARGFADNIYEDIGFITG
jgi:peptide/nickel transport system substrate-binding protein